MLEYYLAAKIDAIHGSLRRISISPNRRWLALAEADTVTLVDMSRYQTRHKIQCGVEVKDVIWTSSGRLLCTRGTEIAVVDISLVSLYSLHYELELILWRTKANCDGQIEISGYPLKMETIEHIAAIDIGEYVCVAAGGNSTVQLVMCIGSSKTLPRSRFTFHTQTPSAWMLAGVLGRPRPTAFSSDLGVDVSSLNWYKGRDGQLTLVVSYVYHGVVYVAASHNQWILTISHSGWAISLDNCISTSAIRWAIATDKW
jgi:hypothetical protein